MYFSPKTSADGLVFHYDTGNTVRSYLGEPTSNLVTNGNFSNSKTGWGFTNVANSATSVGTYQGRNALFANGLKYYNESPGYFYQSISVTQGVQYTISFKYYLLSGTLVFDPDGAYNGGGGLTQSGQWVNYSVTFTASTTSLTLNFYGASGVLAYYYITDIQLEAKSHATPFTTGTRSATQGLKDLTAKNTIDISTVSFDSNAQMTFDGTDDYVDVGDLGTIGSTYSIECVFKSTSVTSYKNVFDMNYATYSGVTGNTGPRLEQTSGQGINFIWSGVTNNNNLYNNTNLFAISANTYYHVAFVQNGTTGAMYVNGTLRDQANNAQGYLQTFGDFNIGRGFVLDPSRYFSGNVDMFKIFNRALTADEVARNYNAIKSRFNIG